MQEEKAKEEKSKPEEYKELVCTSSTQTTTDYTKVIEETFKYNSKNQVVESGVKTTYTFTIANDTYNTLKTQCDENGLKFIDKDGYESGCSYSDTEVVMENSFDLELFKTIQDGANTITSNAKYQEKIADVKNRLTTQGYTCK